MLNSSNYNAFEADGTVSVCAVIMAEALERTIVVQLSSQDSTATSKHMHAVACSGCQWHIIIHTIYISFNGKPCTLQLYDFQHHYVILLDTEDYIAFQLVPLTFDEGSSSGDERCYDVVIVDDNLVEDNEIFFVTLTSPEQTLLGGNLSRATVTINPDPADGKGVCSLKAGSLFEES